MSEGRRIRVGVIGAGLGAEQLLRILPEDEDIKIVALAYRKPDRPVVERANSLGLMLFDDYRDLAESSGIDIIIDATGDPEVEAYLQNSKRSPSEVISGYSAWFLWKMVDERLRRQEELCRNLLEQETLFEIGVALSTVSKIDEALLLIQKAAIKLTGMSAASLALLDEERGVMRIRSSYGFKDNPLPDNYEWAVRPGGLTSAILSKNEPTVIEDLKQESDYDVRPMSDINVQSLMAIPLKVSGKIIGVLYADDFQKKEISSREVNVFRLLAVQAAAALDKAILMDKTEKLAITDGLTRLYNHRYFVQSLDNEMKRAHRHGYPLSLVLIDVDHFKKYNDSMGHVQGNEVLIKLATILQDAARDTDVVARYGGEEFAILLLQTPEEGAREVADRIRKTVEEEEFAGEENLPDKKVTISAGVVTLGQHESCVNIVECADLALYESKQTGRNKVTTYTDLKGGVI